MLHIPESTHRINTNLFAENIALYFGGGVANVNASPVYINNTIADNSATYGGGFYCKDSISPDFYNTIFWGNTAAVGPTGYFFEAFSQADFYYCVVEGGPAQFGGSGGVAFSGAFEQCLDENPQFQGNGEYPYELTWASPCYERGSPDTTDLYLPETDLADNPRLSHGFIDMGAYEVVWVGIGDMETGRGGDRERGRQGDRERIDDVKIWPNPCTDHVFIEVSAEESGTITIEVFDISGRKLKEISRPNSEKGKQQFYITSNDLGAGKLFSIKISLVNDEFILKIIRENSLYSR
jgi:predicted outer membrane repeat protein